MGLLDSSPLVWNNVNTIWAAVLAETLSRLGLQTAIICPGSRSAPLAVAFAQHPAIEALPVLDERSAAFLALGLARRSGKPVVLVCTSGTAGANFYPAVIEAKESKVPLLILTADRPSELRDCNAGQTIDQQKLYGSFPNWYSETALPALDLALLSYFRQTLVYAWERTQFPIGGVVHLNLPFRDPLAPVVQPEAVDFAARFPDDFFEAVAPTPIATPILPLPPLPDSDRGLIIAGLDQPRSSLTYCRAIATLARRLGVPVLAEALSPVRNQADLYEHPTALISTYDAILRQPDWADKLQPDWVIRVGEMPTSKMLRQWLQPTQPQQWIIDPSDRNLDPLHGKTHHVRTPIEQFSQQFQAILAPIPEPDDRTSPYLEAWRSAETQTRQRLDRALACLEDRFEGKVAWLLSQHLPIATPLFVASSTPVRDMEFFWQPNARAIQPYFNRGANGIDGTLSTALGIAHRHRSSVLLTGDLALLHDTNGFLVSRQLVGHLTIVLINNQGGGIFESLPIAQFEPPFEQFFATPQSIDFQQLCQTYGAEYVRIESWQHLIDCLNPLPDQGVRVLEVRCDRKVDARLRRELLRGG